MDMRAVTETNREAAVETLQRAAADGRLPLQDFSERVGTALAAQTRDELEAATAGLKAAPPVGSARAVSSITTFFGNRRQAGRWRLPGTLHARALFGDIHLDLREAIIHDDVGEISATTLFGNLCVDVPEGVEVELTGFDVLGDREGCVDAKGGRFRPASPRRSGRRSAAMRPNGLGQQVNRVTAGREHGGV